MYRMYGIRAMQRDAAFRSDASGTPRASKVLNLRYFFRYFKRSYSHSTSALKIVKKCLRFSALGDRICTGMYRSGAPGIRATQRSDVSEQLPSRFD